MSEDEIESASTTEGLPLTTSMTPMLQSAAVPARAALVDRRVVFISILSIVLAVAAALAAELLLDLIRLVTNLAFYGQWSLANRPPGASHMGLWIMGVPVVGGIIVGLMARFGSQAIRGHGIPEAMEQVLTNESRIPARLTFLKPLSAAIAIGTGGPFGAEGPIIATGGAMGSVLGQIITTTSAERKTLLAAGAAAGMAATFGSPVSAVLLAIELLLFEFRPRSLVPVALAAATAAGVRIAWVGKAPIFPMPNISAPTLEGIGIYIVIGALVGLASIGVTSLVYGIEDLFERLPIHWMWWPAIGAVAVGVIGYFAPRTLGVGYFNISDIISDNAGTVGFVAFLCGMKLISWAVALGSGTSGGTLAPLFTMGSGLGLVLGVASAAALPGAGVDLRIAALVGMAAMFAGASRALLTSAVFAFETTLQPLGLLPLLGGCTSAFLIATLFSRHSIMTAKIARRGIRVPAEYSADFLDTVLVREAASSQPVALREDQTLGEVRRWMESGAAGSAHQGFPVVNAQGHLVGVVTRRDLLDAKEEGGRRVRQLLKRPPIVVYEDCTLRDAADHMVNHDVGRLPVISRNDPGKLVGFITRSDVLRAHRRRLQELSPNQPSIRLPRRWRRKVSV